MKVLLDIPDGKVAFIMELLQNFSFIKTTKLEGNEKVKLNPLQKKAINEGLEALDEGNSSSHDQVVKETKERYPNLFK